MPETTLDLRDCLRRVRLHDEEAARALVNLLYPLVIKIVRSHLPRRTDEEDLAQMIFVKVFTHIDQFSGKVPFEHWVSRIAVNTCFNQLRSERCRPELRWADLGQEEAEVLEKVLTSSETPSPSHEMACRELTQKMLDFLSPEDAMVLSMLDIEGRSVEEIRQTTGWSASLVKVRAFRARRKLRRVFGKLIRELNL